MRKTTIKIEGEKLKSLLESITGKTLSEISRENGFSSNFLSEAVKNNAASSTVQTVTRLYGIGPEAYAVKEETEEAPADGEKSNQLTIDDLLNEEAKTALKAIIKEAVSEIIKEELPKAVMDVVMRAIREDRAQENTRRHYENASKC